MNEAMHAADANGWETTVAAGPDTGPAAIDRFEVCLCETLRHEGGVRQIPGRPFIRGPLAYSNDPDDPGGETMLGVLQRVYDPWRRGRGLPLQSVRRISDDEIRAIYRENYWNLMRCNELPIGVDQAAFDYGVNSGCGRATKDLQRLCRAKPDGALGALTLAAIWGQDPKNLVERLQDTRRAFVQGLKHYWKFGEGWEIRIDHVEAASLRALGVGAGFGIASALSAADQGASGGVPVEGTYAGGRATADAPGSMVESKTGNIAIVTVVATLALLVKEVVATVATVTGEGGRINWLALAIALGTSQTFLPTCGIIGGAVYTWIERRRKLTREAV